MKCDFSADRVLAVVAHPDDAELFCAGALARARRDGASIAVCVLCQGDKGQPDPPIVELASVRRGEMQEAAALLDAELFWGDIPDGQLADTPETRALLLEIFRQFQPTLVLGHAAEDYHADHRAASALTEAATWFAASRGHVTTSPPLAAPPALWWMDTITMTAAEPSLYLDISEFVDLKRAMLDCHRSQLARGESDDFSPLLEHVERLYQTRGAQSGVAAAEAFRPHTAWKRLAAW